jgi:hypothetical protein
MAEAVLREQGAVIGSGMPEGSARIIRAEAATLGPLARDAGSGAARAPAAAAGRQR